MHVLGREAGDGPAGRLGCYRARDGSAGAPVGMDLSGPHAALVVGKRGAGKSHTLGVLAEELAATPGAVPVVADPMGAFGGLREAGFEVRTPRVRASALPPAAWPDLLGVDAESTVGSLVWRAAAERDTLAGMSEFVADADCAGATRRAADNHLRLAASWDAFGGDVGTLDEPTVLDFSGWDGAPMNAALRAVAAALYRRRVAGEGPLPWLVVDEAHAFFDGVASPALRRVLTRGRAPGVSLVAATQRPSALPEVAVSQADLLVAHRLTSERDLDALRAARPSYLRRSLDERLPAATGEALVVDDATERAHEVRVRERETPHGGDAPTIPKASGSAGD